MSTLSHAAVLAPAPAQIGARPASVELDPQAPLGIVFNASSGSQDRQQRLDTIHRVLEQAQRRYTLHIVKKPNQLPAMIGAALTTARQNGALVCAGGDGTINAVLQVAVKENLPLGVLPQGTFNYFARAQGLPLDIEGGVRSLLNARLKPVQVGRINEQLFLVNASVGLYPRLLQDREATKSRYGRRRFVALLAAVRSLLLEHNHHALTLKLREQERTLKASTLFVGNNALQLEQLGLPEAVAIEEGQLAAIAVHPASTWTMFGLLIRGLAGRLSNAVAVESFAFDQLTIEPRGAPYRKLKVAFDGEVQVMQAPLRFEVESRPLQLLVPHDVNPPGETEQLDSTSAAATAA